MNLKEAYQQFGGDYQGVMMRLQNEEMITRLAKKFIDDESYQSLKENLEKNNIDEAFRFVHTLKGICSNFGFNDLYESSCLLTEELRNRQTEHVEEYFKKITSDYEKVIQALKQLD